MRNFTQIAAFAVGTGMQAALGFLSVPLIVRALGIEELGRWSVLEVIFQFGAQVALLGFNQTIIKFIASDGMAPWPAMTRVARSLLPIAVVTSFLAALGAWQWLRLSPVSAVGLAILLCLEFWVVLGLSSARAASMPFAFSAALVTRAGLILAALAIAVLLLPGRIETAADVTWLWVATYSVVGLLLALLVRRRGQVGHAPDRQAMVSGLRYGAPLLGALLLAQTLQYADRFIVSSQLGFAEAGRYFVHAKIANALAMATLPIQLWWPVARFAHLKDSDGGASFFSQASVLGVTFYGVLLIALAAISPLIFRWFAPTEQPDPMLLLLLLCAAYAQASAVFFNVNLLDVGATHMNLVIATLVVAIQLPLQAVLVVNLGIIGAAVGLAVGAVCSLLLQYRFSQYRRPVPFPNLRLLAVSSCAVLAASVLLRGIP